MSQLTLQAQGGNAQAFVISAAKVDTRNFSFEAFGRTEKEARDALLAGLYKHRDQYELNESWADDHLEDANVRYVSFGDCLRDREMLMQA